MNLRNRLERLESHTPYDPASCSQCGGDAIRAAVVIYRAGAPPADPCIVCGAPRGALPDNGRDPVAVFTLDIAGEGQKAALRRARGQQ
jgi:hypothetical protein